MDIPNIIQDMKTATRAMDHIPTSLVKVCLPTVCPLIIEIINSSLRFGQVPCSFKLAAVTPIFKKPGLNPDILNNFRPISNFPFLSKILEFWHSF
ncbi:hypothetical protein LDENG_00261570 [Lucifuga dentata]|nr:hypothetical protein LDENG_00261570 [Lucifuga dentata]